MITSLDQETITRFLQSDQGKDFARESDQYPYIVYRKENWVISVNYGAPNLSKFLFHTRIDRTFKAFSTDDFAEILRQMQIKPFTPLR